MDDIREAVVKEIGTVFRTFLLREATAADIDKHLGHFRDRCATVEMARRVVDEGRTRIYLGIRPLKVVLDTTNRCNIRCVMCHFSDPSVFNRPPSYLSLDDFLRLAPQLLPLAHKLTLSASAEPLMHPHFDQFVRSVGDYQIPVAAFNTNGLLLTEKLMHLLIEVRFNHVGISFDGATAQTYERIRVDSSFAQVIGNIQTLQRLKREVGSERPRLGFNIVLMQSNIRELPAYVRMAADLGIHSINATHMVPYQELDNESESLSNHPALCNQMLDEARAAARLCNVSLIAPDNFSDGQASKTVAPRPLKEKLLARHLDLEYSEDDTVSCCPFPWHFAAFTPSGDMVPCCWWHGEAPMGNIRTETFEQIWNNERYRTLRAELSSGNLRKTCRNCPAQGIGSVDDKHTFELRGMAK